MKRWAAILDVSQLVTVVDDQRIEELGMIVEQAMIEHSGKWKLMNCNSSHLQQIVDRLESVILIDQVLGGPNISDDVGAAQIATWNRSEIDIEDAAVGRLRNVI